MATEGSGARTGVDRQHDLEGQLEGALEAGEMVVVCWEPGCTMHRLPQWREHQWISRPQDPRHHLYSHGICPWHYQAYKAEIDRFVIEELPARQARSASLAAT